MEIISNDEYLPTSNSQKLIQVPQVTLIFHRNALKFVSQQNGKFPKNFYKSETNNLIDFINM